MTFATQLDTTAAIATLEATFRQVVALLHEQQQADEVFALFLRAEHSQFTRFNQAKVRQTGTVQDGVLDLTLYQAQRSSLISLPLTGIASTDLPVVLAGLAYLRTEIHQLPTDPYLVLPTGQAQSCDRYAGQLLPPTEVAAAILPAVAGLDFAGLYAGGWVIRAYADSCGQFHWFATETFALDYSLFTAAGQAVKGTLAGSIWSPDRYTQQIGLAKTQLAQLSATPPRVLPRGQYRTYLAPAAVADLVGMFSWGAVSESMLQRGGSALAAMRRDGQTLSPRFTLTENFQSGLVPRFNHWGELAPLELPIIEQGQLKNTLISARTAKEFHLVANGAASGEYLRSPTIQPGTLAPDAVLSTLDTGLYVSNLHYLNWSDRPTGRITGMTRYACFWVEQGELVAPIANLRFDESLYRCFGDRLVDFTTEPELIPAVDTYGHRELGGTLTPGLLVDDFTYTL